jgi:hypothetical protein
MSYVLRVKDSNAVIGQVSEAQLQQLVELLEEEDTADQDYYLDAATLAFLEERGADPTLLALLQPHIPPDGGIDVVWQEA